MNVEVQCRSAAGLCLEELHTINDSSGKHFWNMKTHQKKIDLFLIWPFEEKKSQKNLLGPCLTGLQSGTPLYTNVITDSSKSGAKDFWRAFKQTLPSGKTSSRITSLLADGTLLITSAHSIDSAFNTFFVNVGKSPAEKFVPEPYTAKTRNCHSTFSLQPISEDFVEDLSIY